MALVLHTVSGSSPGWRVMLAMAFKNIDYGLHVLQTSKKEQKAPDFLRLNPRGTVPVLEADGLVIRESIAILAWLDRVYPQPPLFGTTPDQAAVIWQMTTEASEFLRSATNGVVRPAFRGDGSPPQAGSEEADKLNRAASILDKELESLESSMAERQFLCGDKVSAADAVVYPEIARIQRAIETKPGIMESIDYDKVDARFPKLANWRERITALPGVGDTVPTHWRTA